MVEAGGVERKAGMKEIGRGEEKRREGGKIGEEEEGR